MSAVKLMNARRQGTMDAPEIPECQRRPQWEKMQTCLGEWGVVNSDYQIHDYILRETTWPVRG